eukprot:m.783207 g.783207  ORF g.783207 m.783207 type:complete len:1328 (+) comp23293_c0_seq5:175-4158(+)
MALRSPRYYDDDEQVTEEDLNAIRKTMVWDDEPAPATYKKTTPSLAVTTAVPVQSVEDEETSSARSATSLLEVYLRIRPNTEQEDAAQENEDPFLTITDSTSIVANPPASSSTSKSGSNKGPTSYTFSNIFPNDTTQREFFLESTLPLVKNTLEGNDSLLFTYGVTNAGKTYTVTGVPEDTGVLPRALDVIFNSIENHSVKKPKLKPHCFSDVCTMSAADVKDMGLLKESIIEGTSAPPSYTRLRQQSSSTSLNGNLPGMLSRGGSRNNLFDNMNSVGNSNNSTRLSRSSRSSSTSRGHRGSAASGGTTTDADVAEDDADGEEEEDDDDDLRGLESDARVADDTAVPVDDDFEYSIFISYAEVYNDYVYDLLLPPPQHKEDRRETCRLGESRQGEVYIRGLREVLVSNSTEAIRILCAGQRNRRVAATKSNVESSRSHCLFTVKVVRQPKKRAKGVASASVGASVSQLTIVDLAGAERGKKTKARGNRIKEAGTINNSLMTLGKCLDGMKWNQAHRLSKRLIPYRESKLTRLFKTYLEGKGSTSMIVNIANVNAYFDESAHVLKFSALARQVTAAPVVSRIDNGRPQPQRHMSGIREQEYEEEITELETYNETLLSKLQDVTEKLAMMQAQSTELEATVRTEVAEEMAERMMELEESYQNAMTEQTEATESKFSRKWGVYTKSVARMPAQSRVGGATEPAKETVCGIPEEAVAEFQEKIEQLTTAKDSALAVLQDEVKMLTAEKESAAAKISALERNLEVTTAEWQDMKNIVDSLQRDIKKKAEEIAFKNDEISELETQTVTLREKATRDKTRAKEHETRSRQLSAQVETQEKLLHNLQVQVAQQALELEGLPTVAVVDELKQALTQAEAERKSDALKHKNILMALKRKLKAKEDTIQTLTRAVQNETGKNDQLRGQLAGALEEQMDSKVKQLAHAEAVTSKISEPSRETSRSQKAPPPVKRRNPTRRSTRSSTASALRSDNFLHVPAVVIDGLASAISASPEPLEEGNTHRTASPESSASPSKTAVAAAASPSVPAGSPAPAPIACDAQEISTDSQEISTDVNVTASTDASTASTRPAMAEVLSGVGSTVSTTSTVISLTDEDFDALLDDSDDDVAAEAAPGPGNAPAIDADSPTTSRTSSTSSRAVRKRSSSASTSSRRRTRTTAAAVSVDSPEEAPSITATVPVSVPSVTVTTAHVSPRTGRARQPAATKASRRTEQLKNKARAKRKAARQGLDDDTAGTTDPSTDKENVTVAVPAAREDVPPSSAIKKKRKLFQRGAINSPLADKNHMGTLPPPSASKNSRVKSLLTPIKRRLRPRKKTEYAL